MNKQSGPSESGREPEPLSKGSLLSSKALDAYLKGDPLTKVRDERGREKYDLLSFGGGSCPKVVGRYAGRFGWKKLCFLTNGSDNGGSTQRIVEALNPEYGPTLPVGDVTSALIGLLEPFRYELLNLRSWKLDPQRFTEDEREAFLLAVQDISSFHDRLALAIKWYFNKFDEDGEVRSSREKFCGELLELGRLVDDVGLIRPGVKGLDISEASIRHHIFNAIMIRTGAYDADRKTPDADQFMVALFLLQSALSIDHAIFPCSIDKQVLYAEWVDESGKVIWSTKHTSPERPVTALDGQVALSNAPDSAKLLKNGGYARYGRFGFDPGLPEPHAYPEAIDAIRRVQPGKPILFGPSSFVASISPCLAVSEVTDEIVKRTDCPRILFLNLTLNSETVGWNVKDYLDFWELNTGKPVAETLDYIVVNNDIDSTSEVIEALKDKGDTLETYKFRGPVKLTEEERTTIPQRGVHLVELPLATVSRTLMRLSSTGEREFVWVPSHDSKRLMTLSNLLVEDFNERQRPGGPREKTRQFVLDTDGNTKAVIYYPPPENR